MMGLHLGFCPYGSIRADSGDRGRLGVGGGFLPSQTPICPCSLLRGGPAVEVGDSPARPGGQKGDVLPGDYTSVPKASPLPFSL